MSEPVNINGSVQMDGSWPGWIGVVPNLSNLVPPIPPMTPDQQIAQLWGALYTLQARVAELEKEATERRIEGIKAL